MQSRFRPALPWLDPVLGLCWAGLVALGWLLIYSVSYYQKDLISHPLRQAAFMLCGLLVQALVCRFSLRRWLDWAPGLYLGSLLLLALVPWIGLEVNGARRWLWLGPLGALQPSEFVKFTLLLLQLRLLAERRWDLALVALLPPSVLVLKQPDLGTAACYAATTLALLFVSGMDLRWLLVGVLSLLWAVSQGLHDYQRERLLMFLDPEQDPTGAGWNLIQAKIAVGSGGLQGLGLFQGLQKRLLFVPEQHTDFVFTVLAEEGGLIGASLMLLLFGLLFARGFRLARRSGDSLSAWACAAVCGSLGFQTLVNLAMVVGLCPVTGIPLPLISYGGSALLVQSALLGLLHGQAAVQARAQRLQPRLLWAPRGVS